MRPIFAINFKTNHQKSILEKKRWVTTRWAST